MSLSTISPGIITENDSPIISDICQPRTQDLFFTLLAGEETVVDAGHPKNVRILPSLVIDIRVAPKIWEPRDQHSPGSLPRARGTEKRD